MKLAKGLLIFFAFMSTGVVNALDLSGVAVDTTDFETIAVFLIGALVVFWGIRKGIKLISNDPIKSAFDRGLKDDFVGQSFNDDEPY
jgi:hypothetical protein